ncbi:hypothetical protein ACFQNE_07135 [Gordonia phosphorivorans]|uniref:BtpA/SgcQ family protein n=1 Tax=Gordonia phosphorivorans TaxID=1056982 RepID=A0ABV6H4A7_9ACTN
MQIFPVVHLSDFDNGLEQAEIALAANADGVYLIDHSGRTDRLVAVANALTTRAPGAFIGVNLLGYSAAGAATYLVDAITSGLLSRAPNGLWIDDVSPTDSAMAIKRANATLATTQILGGIAFKYTPTFTEEPTAAAAEVVRLRDEVDVVTTSGAGTGTPPTPAKISAMAAAAGRRPLAVTSGLAAENLADYADAIDQVLVASSVETAPYSGIFDTPRLTAMIAAAHA